MAFMLSSSPKQHDASHLWCNGTGWMVQKLTFGGIFIAASLAGCATSETRLRNGLINAGLSSQASACMADRMIDKLSLAQLRRLSDLSKIKEQRLGQMRVGEFWRQVRALRDPEILSITARAGLSCAISE
jgi:hypothetical protein